MLTEEIIAAVLFFLFGTVIGSFLNVCIFRIPNKENMISKRSHCMACGNVLKWYELVPLVSFLIQGGKCRKCHTKLSWQYPFIEALNGAVWVWIYLTYGLSVESILFCLCASTLIVISVIDWRTFEIPLGCNIFIALLGVARLVLDPAHWQSYVLGFFIVSVFLYILYLVTKGRGIGGGDIKLMAAAGLLLGWKAIVLALIIGSLLGAVIHLARMKLQDKDSVLAFGPYLSAGIFISMLYADNLIQSYIKYFWNA